jgi:hypothetical protein
MCFYFILRECDVFAFHCFIFLNIKIMHKTLLLLFLCFYIVAAIEFQNKFEQDHSNYGDYHNNKE